MNDKSGEDGRTADGPALQDSPDTLSEVEGRALAKLGAWQDASLFRAVSQMTIQ